MSEELTREELNAVIETTRKQTEQTVIIVTLLQGITINQQRIITNSEAIIAKLSNGLKDAVAAKVKVEIENSSIAKDIRDAKFFIGMVGIAIVVVSTLLNVIDRRWTDTSQIRKIIQMEQQLKQ